MQRNWKNLSWRKIFEQVTKKLKKKKKDEFGQDKMIIINDEYLSKYGVVGKPIFGSSGIGLIFLRKLDNGEIIATDLFEEKLSPAPKYFEEHQETTFSFEPFVQECKENEQRLMVAINTFGNIEHMYQVDTRYDEKGLSSEAPLCGKSPKGFPIKQIFDTLFEKSNGRFVKYANTMFRVDVFKSERVNEKKNEFFINEIQLLPPAETFLFDSYYHFKHFNDIAMTIYNHFNKYLGENWPA